MAQGTCGIAVTFPPLGASWESALVWGTGNDSYALPSRSAFKPWWGRNEQGWLTAKLNFSKSEFTPAELASFDLLSIIARSPKQLRWFEER